MTSNQIRGEGVKFNRLRRITGYLTNTIECWNLAKQCEERDRVKHDYKTKVLQSKEYSKM